MKNLTMFLSVFIALSCGRDSSTPDVSLSPQQQEKILKELESNYSLEKSQESILSSVTDDEVQVVKFAPDETLHLDRPLSDSEVLKGQQLATQIASEYDSKFKTNAATETLNNFRVNDSSFVANCYPANRPEHTMKGVDGKTYKINKSSSAGYQILHASDESLYRDGFSDYHQACRYITSDEVGKRYVAHLKKTGIEFKFPAKFKKTGSSSGGGRIQSLNGSMIADFCARNFADTDGLDTLNLCQ